MDRQVGGSFSRGIALLFVAVLLFPCQVFADNDRLIELLSDRQSEIERECAEFLLTGRLHDSEGSPPAQCQNYVRTYLEDADHGHRVNRQKECMSFLMNAELNNIQGWLPPYRCEKFIKSYMEDGQYEADVQVATSAAGSFLRSFSYVDRADAVVFDIDETALSNMPYYRDHRYGVEKFQKSLFNEYVSQSSQPPLLPVLSLYKELRRSGWAIIFITGRDEEARDYTAKNLREAGFEDWDELVLRDSRESHASAVEYKSKRRLALEERGYRIRTSIGDQWSDLEGFAAGTRTFKLPNPMYYIF